MHTGFFYQTGSRVMLLLVLLLGTLLMVLGTSVHGHGLAAGHSHAPSPQLCIAPDVLKVLTF